jgi:LSD1 subclass zinc finger protein
MPLQVICPGCKKPLQLPDGSQGKQVRCPMCQVIFAIGGVAPPPPVAAPPPRPAPAAPTNPPKAPPPCPQPAPTPTEPPPVSARKKPAPIEEDDEPPLPKKAKRPAKERAEFEPIRFVLKVAHDPDREMLGGYQAEISPDGLLLSRDKEEYELPRGTPAAQKRGNRLELKVEGRKVQFDVVRMGELVVTPLTGLVSGLRVNRYRLSLDVPAFLDGTRDNLKAKDYQLPWYLYAPVLLPLGLPCVTCGGILPIAAAFLLSAACFAIVQQGRWPAALRVGLSTLISFVGYGLVIAILAIISHFSEPKYGFEKKPTLPENDWQLYTSPEGDFEVLLPGKPEVLTNPHPGVQVKIDKPEVTFRVHYFTVGPDKRLDLKDHEVRDQVETLWPDLTTEVMRDYPQNKKDYGQFASSEQLPNWLYMNDRNPKVAHGSSTTILFERFGDRVYCATVTTPSANGLSYDINKFSKSVKINYKLR